MKIDVKVVPNSKTNEIIQGIPLIVRVKAKAENNEANISVIKLLSKHFKKKIKIVKGLTSKRKVVEVN